MESYKDYFMGDLNVSRLNEELAASPELPADLFFEQRGFETVNSALIEPKARVLSTSHGEPTPEGTALEGEYRIHTEEALSTAKKIVVGEILTAHDPAELSAGQANAEKAKEYTEFIEANIDDPSLVAEVNYRSAWLSAWLNGGFEV